MIRPLPGTPSAASVNNASDNAALDAIKSLFKDACARSWSRAPGRQPEWQNGKYHYLTSWAPHDTQTATSSRVVGAFRGAPVLGQRGHGGGACCHAFTSASEALTARGQIYAPQGQLDASGIVPLNE